MAWDAIYLHHGAVSLFICFCGQFIVHCLFFHGIAKICKKCAPIVYMVDNSLERMDGSKLDNERKIQKNKDVVSFFLFLFLEIYMKNIIQPKNIIGRKQKQVC